MFHSLKSVLMLFLTSFVISSYGTHLRNITNSMYVGSYLSPVYLHDDPVYAKMAAEEFNSITLSTMWKAMQPHHDHGHIDYTLTDQVVDYAERNGMTVRGNALVYAVPKWVDSYIHTQDIEKLRSVMRHWVRDVVSHYKGRVFAWDVLNELFEENESGAFKETLFYKALGKPYIVEALRTAHEADPNARLYINDVFVEGINNKSNALYALVKELLSEGVPIHGVGMQTHVIVDTVPKDVAKNMQRFADLGLDVAITEMDIRIELPIDDSMVRQQARDYAEYYSACKAVDRCVGVTVWGFTDKYSWIAEHFPGYDSGCLWDREFRAKSAVDAVENVLKS